MVAFRGDQYLWWQVAEYTYDNFMIARIAAAGKQSDRELSRHRTKRPGESRAVFVWRG